MNMDFVWVRQRGMYIATVHDERGAASLDHHFEADPKLLSADDIWMEWLKQIADFMKEHGRDVTKIQTKIADYNAIYYTGERIKDDNDTREAGPTGGPDDRRGHSDPAGDTGADRSGLSSGEPHGAPPPIAPSWPGAEEIHRPGAAGTDGHSG
jgi:hypothetical protein